MEKIFNKISSDVLENALEYSKTDNSDRVINNVIEILNKLKRDLAGRVMDAYTAGVKYAEDKKPNRPLVLRSEITKNKDFAFFFNFKDDEALPVYEFGIKTFVNAYNKVLNIIDSYATDNENHEHDEVIELYSQGLIYMEQESYIVEMLKRAFLTGAINQYNTLHSVWTMLGEFHSEEDSEANTNIQEQIAKIKILDIDTVVNGSIEDLKWYWGENKKFPTSDSDKVELTIGTKDELIKKFNIKLDESEDLETGWWNTRLFVYVEDGLMQYRFL